MRREMRANNVEFKVAKKTLLKLAAKEQGIELPDEIVEGTVGAVFSYNDAVSGPKIVKTTSKEVEVLKLLGGIMDGAILSIEEMGELASLPSRDQLLAKFMMMLRSPLQSFHGAVSSPLSSFARALDAYSDQMPEEASAAEPAPAPEAAPAEEKAEEAPKEEEKTAEEAPAEEAAAPEAETPTEENSEEEPSESK
jgi:large subunit ribosomal protein L10